MYDDSEDSSGATETPAESMSLLSPQSPDMIAATMQIVGDPRKFINCFTFYTFHVPSNLFPSCFNSIYTKWGGGGISL